MGIAGSYCDADMFQKYFGIRAEWVDMTEIIRRITLGIYDHEEYEKALAWVKANCHEGFDYNAGKDAAGNHYAAPRWYPRTRTGSSSPR